MSASFSIVGAGPAGTLLATYLARQGHEVSLYEARSDLRRTDVDSGRSINLALATRGIVPLIEVGVIDKVDAITIPMRGRIVHSEDGSTPSLQPYGNQDHEVIHSVSRSDLNAILLDAAEATGRVSIEFEKQLTSVDFDTSTLAFDDGTIASFEVLVGADGAGSLVRKALGTAKVCTYETERLGHSYKELTLPSGPDHTHLLDPHGLHIWPRGEFMLIALANPEGDFTVTLFAPTETFDALDSDGAIDAFFAAEFPDFVAQVPDIAVQFRTNPTGSLGTLRAAGWSLDNRVVLLGDAAHAIVPFHGQGMNAAMESARVLDRCVRTHPDDLAMAFHEYESERKPNTEAIADMALDNYKEMRAGVIDPDYLAARSLALELEQRHPGQISPRYNMVMFSTMPYAEAKERATRQASIISAAINDPSIDVDSAIAALPALPPRDPLADQKALSTS